MEKELKTLPNEINTNENDLVDLYINKTPLEKKSSSKIFFIIGIFIIIFVIVSISILFYCCQSEKNEKVKHVDSDTSTRSNISEY